MISILLATYNGEKYLSLSIESILNQSFNDFELLIGFNGTTDNSKDLLLKYNDPRIRYFDYNEKGKSKTLNKLIKEAKYDWVAIQDDDDIWIKTKLEKQIPLLISGEYDIIGTFINYINKDGDITGKPKLSSSHEDIKNLSFSGINQIANTSAIFRKSDAIYIEGWREIDGIEDFDFWLRLMRCNKIFINIPEELVNHRLHNESNFNTKSYDLKKIL